MCQSIAKGGQRCAAHTRPAYQQATYGTAEWDDAAASYGATREGEQVLIEYRNDAAAAGNIEAEVAAQAALDRAASTRAAAAEFRATMRMLQRNPTDTPILSRGNPTIGLHQEWRDSDSRFDESTRGVNYHHPRHEAIRRTDGTIEYHVGGRLHRVGEPAIVRSNGDVEYWENGRRNRPDGEPAIVRTTGENEYWENDRRHREGGPAITRINHAHGHTETEYWDHGRKHRTDGPAVSHSDGYTEYWDEGERHRDNGPAVIYPDGRQAFWRKGQPVAYKMLNADGTVQYDSDAH